jgi:hypothetical protein
MVSNITEETTFKTSYGKTKEEMKIPLKWFSVKYVGTVNLGKSS